MEKFGSRNKEKNKIMKHIKLYEQYDFEDLSDEELFGKQEKDLFLGENGGGGGGHCIFCVLLIIHLMLLYMIIWMELAKKYTQEQCSNINLLLKKILE